MRRDRSTRGFTLTEVLVTMLLIAALAGIAFPIARSVMRSADEAGCLSNLRQIGIALESYIQDHNQRLPDLAAGRRSRDEDVPVLETVLDEYVDREAVFHCPADDEQFRRSGSSYLWNTTQSGVRRNRLEFFGTDKPNRIPLVIDKEAWHGDGEAGSNFLYADLTASHKVQFAVSP